MPNLDLRKADVASLLLYLEAQTRVSGEQQPGKDPAAVR